jgi:hypothetical protein
VTDNLERAGRKLRLARRAQSEAMEAARLAALDAIERGFTEVEVATTLGVDRMTVRKWGGKR